MSDSAELASPIADVRDVVETYRLYGVLTSDWRDVLTAASDALDRLPQPTRSEARIPGLVPRLRQLAAAGLRQGDPVLDEVAAHVQSLLQASRVPGIPRPDDEHWEFEEPSGPSSSGPRRSR